MHVECDALWIGQKRVTALHRHELWHWPVVSLLLSAALFAKVIFHPFLRYQSVCVTGAGAPRAALEDGFVVAEFVLSIQCI
jgi:hypothetical protein